jgi:hypothetical protein
MGASGRRPKTSCYEKLGLPIIGIWGLVSYYILRIPTTRQTPAFPSGSTQGKVIHNSTMFLLYNLSTLPG